MAPNPSSTNPDTPPTLNATYTYHPPSSTSDTHASPSNSTPPSTDPSTNTQAQAPTQTKTSTHALPSLPTNNTSSPTYIQEKTAYLSHLRTSIPKLQDEINEFLTEKMEADKFLAASQAKDGKGVDDVKEEERYGEEGEEAEEGKDFG